MEYVDVFFSAAAEGTVICAHVSGVKENAPSLF
jgi:hypothetical protein